MGPVIGEDGKVDAFFFVTVDLDWLDEQVNRVAIPKEAVLLVMDGRGTEIARNPRSPNWPTGTPAPPLERTLVGKGDFDGEVKGDDGIRRVYSVAKVRSGEGLLVVMKMRSSEIYRSARLRLAMHLGGLAGVGFLVLGLTWFGSDRYLTRPLSRLIEMANRLASGSLGSRTGLGYNGDIGVLAQSFDRMAEAVEREQIKTLRTSQTLRSIIEGTSASTGEDFFRALVRSLTSALRADFALVGELMPDLASVKTLAICFNGRIVENTLYELRGTPCEGVVNADACYYAAGIQELFPEDAMLRDLGMQSYLAAPLEDEAGKPLGLIAVLHGQPMADVVTDPVSMLRIFAARASAELTRLRAERALRQSVAAREVAARKNEDMVRSLQALTARLQSVREEERTHIAREIHDELGQQLTAMRFDLISLRNRQMQIFAKGEPRELLVKRFSDLTGMIDAMIADVRRIATELRPAILDTFGLSAAIEWLAEDFQKRTKIRCVYEGIDDVAMDRELSTTLFRICQESLTNIARHAEASEAHIRLKADEEWLSLEVNDNGKGISPEVLINTRSLGVAGMSERARIAGGEFIIESGRGESGRGESGRGESGRGESHREGDRPTEGTTIIARFPRRVRPLVDGASREPIKSVQ